MEQLVFDIRGQLCPSTLLTALREVNSHRQQLREKSVRLLFLTDNRQCTLTIPDAVRNMGYSVQIAKEQSYYRVLVE